MIRRLLTVVITALALTLGAYGQTAGAAKAKAKTSAGDAKTKTTADTKANAQLVDINSASEAELDALPGIGKAYAKKIIANRPYANKTQLVSKGVVPQRVYDKVSAQIIAKQK